MADKTKITKDWSNADQFLRERYEPTKKYVDNQINPEFVYDETAVSCKTVPENVKDFAVVEKIYGKTIKDGETLKSAPIESVVSKTRNLLDISTVTKTTNQNVTFTPNGDGTVSVSSSGAASAQASAIMISGTRLNRLIVSGDLIPGKKYTISGAPSGASSTTYLLFGYKVNSDGSSVSAYTSATFTAPTTFPSDANIGIVVKSGYTASNVIFKPMLTKENDSLTFTPYNKTTISVPESIKNLEGYGLGISDTVRNYVDFEAGKYYKYCGSVDLGSLTYTYDSSEGKGWFYTASAGINNAKAPTASEVGNFITGKYTTTSRNEIPNIDDAVCMLTTAKIIIKDTSAGTDPNVFKTALSGQMFVYELATPEVIDISDIIRPIKCETGGTTTLVNEHNLDVANTIIYEREVSEHD